MVKFIKIITVIFFIIIISNCSSNNVSSQHKIQVNYDQGIDFYNNKKYSKAKESFQYVILNSSGSRLALESEFYLSESLYYLKEYEEALYGYDNYARSSQNLNLIERSRFRLSECAYNLAADYTKDQTTTLDAIDKIEIFLEDYPNSEYYLDIFPLKLDLQYRLVKKKYESAILYMKLQEYKSALVYLFDILNNHVPLRKVEFPILSLNEYNIFLNQILDNVRIMIIFAYSLDERIEMAQEFYQLHLDNFYSLNAQEKAVELIELNKANRIDMWKHIYFGNFE